jgi:hypothetical protein
MRLWIIAIALTLAGLACDLAVSGPTPPGSPIPVSTEAAGELTNLWNVAATSAPKGGEVSITLTEAQLTSFVALRLQDQPDAPLQDVQVFLRDGKIQLFGNAQAGSVKTTALVVIAVSVTPEGTLRFTAEKADFGPLPVPSALLDSLSTTLTEAFTGNVGSTATGLKITSILIADGQMAITGVITR